MTTLMIHEHRDDGSGDYTDPATWIADTAVDLTAATTKVFAHGGVTGAIANGASLTGQTSGATGNAVGPATSTQVLIESISGTFASGEQVQIDGSNHVTLSDAGDDAKPVLETTENYTHTITSRLNISGATTDATNFRVWRVNAASRHDGVDPTTGFHITSGFLGDDYLRVGEAYSGTEYIGLDHADTSSNLQAAVSSNNANAYHIGLLAKHASGAGANMRGFTGPGRFYSCGDVDHPIGFKVNDFQTAEHYNCFTKDATTGFESIGANGTYDFRNCFPYGGTTRFNVSSGTDNGSTNNAADNGSSVTPPGLAAITVDVDSGDVNDAANDDMQPLATATDTLHETGSDLSGSWTDSFGTVDPDITGVAFPANWNIGAFGTSISAGSIIPAIMHHNKLLRG